MKGKLTFDPNNEPEAEQVEVESWPYLLDGVRRVLRSGQDKRLDHDVFEALAMLDAIEEALKDKTEDADEWRLIAAKNEVEFRSLGTLAAKYRTEIRGYERHQDELKFLHSRLSQMKAVLQYAADMPDDENMPEWAKELRHRARTVLAGERGDS